MTAEIKPVRKFRRIYPFKCVGCGKQRYTLVFARKKAGYCTTCRRDVPVEGQEPLFNPPVDQSPITNISPSQDSYESNQTVQP